MISLFKLSKLYLQFLKKKYIHNIDATGCNFIISQFSIINIAFIFQSLIVFEQQYQLLVYHTKRIKYLHHMEPTQNKCRKYENIYSSFFRLERMCHNICEPVSRLAAKKLCRVDLILFVERLMHCASHVRLFLLYILYSMLCFLVCFI